MAIDRTHQHALLDASLTTGGAAGAAVQSTHPIRCRLMTTNGSDTAAGTELTTGGGYTSGTGAPTVQFAAAASGSKASNTAVSVTNMPAPAGGSIVGVELWDSSPARKWWAALTASKAVNAGDTFTIASGSITANLA